MKRLILVATIGILAAGPSIAAPGWRVALGEKLETTKVTFKFQGVPAHALVRQVARFAGVGIVLDAPLRDAPLSLDLEAESVKEVLTKVAKALKAEWDLRWGCVFIAKRERLDLLPEDLPGTFAALDKPVSFDFVDVELPRVLEMMTTYSGVPFEVDPSRKEQVANAVVSVTASQASLRDVLCRLLFPADLAAVLEGGVVKIVPPMVKRELTWQEKLEWALENTRVNIDFEDTAFEEALNFLSMFAQVPIAIDSEVAQKRSEGELLVTLRANDITVKNAIELITLTKSLAYDLRWGCLFVSLTERLEKLPKTVLADKPEAEQPRWEQALRKQLEGPVTFTFDEAPVSQALDFIRTLKGINIVLDPSAKEHAEINAVTLTVSDVPIRSALSLILIPRGLTFRLEDEVVLVVKQE